MVGIPIVTLDKIYIKPDEENIYFLDCTRISETDEIVSRKSESLDSQIERLSKVFKNKKILLADDVVFSGSVLKNIIKRFNKLGIEIIGIIASICSNEAYNYFNNNLKYGIKTNILLGEDVIDQICERDFYYGIVGSGISVKEDGIIKKAPYFVPFGEPCERASIPRDYEKYFSGDCIYRSLRLWEEIERLNKRPIMVSELPEEISFSEDYDSIVKTLKMGVRACIR